MMKQAGVETKINCLYVILDELHVSRSIEATIKNTMEMCRKNYSLVLHKFLICRAFDTASGYFERLLTADLTELKSYKTQTTAE